MGIKECMQWANLNRFIQKHFYRVYKLVCLPQPTTENS